MKRVLLTISVLALGISAPSAFAAADDAAATKAAVEAGFKYLAGLKPSTSGGNAIGVFNPALLPTGGAPTVGANITSIGLGQTTTGLPCFGCVPGVSSFSIATPIPLSAMAAGSSGEYTIQFFSSSYTGVCAGGFALISIATKQVLDSGSLAFPGGCNPGFAYSIYWNHTIPNVPGNAVVVGSFLSNTTPQGMSQPFLITP